MSKASPDNNKAPESLSFQDITAEVGDIRLPVAERSSTEQRQDVREAEIITGGTIIVDEGSISHSSEERISSEALTGSSPKPRPMWMDGLACSMLAALFITPIVLNIGLRSYQPWVSFIAMFLAFGAVLWSLFGLQVEKQPAGRKMCLISAALNLFVTVIAFIVRAPLQ